MKLLRPAAATSEIWQIFVLDSSSSTGAALTGLAFNTANLVAYYHRDTNTTATAISLVTMTVGTFTSGGFKEIDATNMPGWYQFCPPNAALAAGAKTCGFHLKGATNMVPLAIEVQIDGIALTDVLSDSTAFAGADIATTKGRLPTALTGAGNIKADSLAINGQTTAAAASVTFPSSVASPTNITAGIITTVTNVTNAPTVGDFTSTMKTSIATAVSGILPLLRNSTSNFVPFQMLDSTNVLNGKNGIPTITRALDGASVWSVTTGTVTQFNDGTGACIFVPSAADCNAQLCRYKAALTGAVTVIVNCYTHT